jgi:hypothetical protein
MSSVRCVNETGNEEMKAVSPIEACAVPLAPTNRPGTENTVQMYVRICSCSDAGFIHSTVIVGQGRRTVDERRAEQNRQRWPRWAETKRVSGLTVTVRTNTRCTRHSTQPEARPTSGKGLLPSKTRGGSWRRCVARSSPLKLMVRA